jgi:hypothetical protein
MKIRYTAELTIDESINLDHAIMSRRAEIERNLKDALDSRVGKAVGYWTTRLQELETLDRTLRKGMTYVEEEDNQ